MSDELAEVLSAALDAGPYLNGGICVIDADGWERVAVAGLVHPPLGRAAPERLTDPGLRMRVASVSKAVTARAACELAVMGVLDLDAEVACLLDWVAPPALMAGVTPRHLLNHTSGLTDAAGYIHAPPESAADFVTLHADRIGSGHPPGRWFRYANLNYVLLGAVLEAASGQRFDVLARDLVLGPAGIAGGFNWAGVSPARRKRHLPLYQRAGSRLERRTEPDGAEWGADIVLGDGGGAQFADYRPVRDTILLSPHAGLRINVIEAARLARLLGDDSDAGQLQRTPSWRFDPVHPNGNACDGLFAEVGLGLARHPDDPRIGRPLVGHAGHALGFTGGVWHNPETGASAGLFLTGSADCTTPEGDEPFYGPGELALMRAL